MAWQCPLLTSTKGFINLFEINHPLATFTTHWVTGLLDVHVPQGTRMLMETMHHILYFGMNRSHMNGYYAADLLLSVVPSFQRSTINFWSRYLGLQFSLDKRHAVFQKNFFCWQLCWQKMASHQTLIRSRSVLISPVLPQSNSWDPF